MSQMTNQASGPGEEPGTPGDQSELDLGVVATGDPAVDEALAGLEPLDALPVAGHPAVFEAVHQGLSQAMSRASGEPNDPAPARH